MIGCSVSPAARSCPTRSPTAPPSSAYAGSERALKPADSSAAIPFQAVRFEARQSDLNTRQTSDVLVIGGGLAGIVTALECLRGGLKVTLIDRDTAARFGGLALWAFGGMCLVGTPQQARAKIPDSPARALEDWLRFGQVDADDRWSRAWARHYVERSRPDVHD